MLRIHDIVTRWKGLYLPGVELYADRALVLSGAAVVQDGPIDGYLGWLREVGIGPDEVVRVPGQSPVAEIMGDLRLRRRVRELAERYGSVQFFYTTEQEERLVEALGLGPERAFSPPQAIGDEASCKVAIRRLADGLGLRRHFPFHVICRAFPWEAYAAVYAVMCGDCDFVVLKAPDLASGDGMVRIDRTLDWPMRTLDFLARFAGREIIVEAGYRHVPMSVQWELGSAGPRLAFAADQLIEGDFTHVGNVVSTGALVHVSSDSARCMAEMSAPFARSYWERGYRGVCGFDFMLLPDGRLFLLECNGRVTATTYCWGVVRQLRGRTGDVAVAMSRIRPRGPFASFDALSRELGGSLFDGERGVLPFNVRCLELERPECSVCCVAGDAEGARLLLEETRRRVQ
ncbi:hypothetical protein ACFL26_02115 [Patescibacteria group bacterium]